MYNRDNVEMKATENVCKKLYRFGPAWQVACRLLKEVFNYIEILLPPKVSGGT